MRVKSNATNSPRAQCARFSAASEGHRLDAAAGIDLVRPWDAECPNFSAFIANRNPRLAHRAALTAIRLDARLGA
jgi:hypothetical protein